MFKLKNVTKKYNEEFALNDVSLTIRSGMNFIIGASGSGKSTLLKIISGIEKDFNGEVYYENKNIQELKEKEKSYFYNNILGFIWQDFNLLEDLTVMENILLPIHLKEHQNIDYAKKVIGELKLNNLENKKVKYLSGGQKQRVAIARELMKTPKVILADEPTSALDKQTSKEIMEILRKIAENRTVIIVTHDTTHITPTDNVYELDKGELISKNNINDESEKGSKIFIEKLKNISFDNIKDIVKTNIIRHKGRFITSVITLILGISLLLTTTSGSIKNSSEGAFDELFAAYGESILDISVYKSFMSAAGTGGADNDKPKADVNQNISGLYDKYNNDERIQFITYIQPFDNIKISIDNKNYSIKSSGNTPVINKLVAGRMANGTENEVVVPKSFVKKMGISPEEALGKKIDFNGDVTKWTGNNLEYKPTKTKAKIVGVMDTTIFSEYDGKIYDFEIEDSFLFSKLALKNMLEQADINIDNLNFLIRAKTPADTISIKEELNKKGIVPLGQFELIEDIVKLNETSTKQSSSGNTVITILTIVMTAAITIVTTIMRKKEYAIFKITGYSNFHLRKINAFEIGTIFLLAIASMIILSPILNLVIVKIFGMKVLTLSTFGMSLLLGAGLAILVYILTEIICDTINVTKILKSGEKE